MRAINHDKYGGITVMQVNKSTIPVITDDEVLIRVFSASINPYDWKLRNGELSGFFNIEFPLTPGRDGCGEIVSIGKMAKWQSPIELKKGLRVSFISSQPQYGAMAEFIAVKANGFVTPAPEKMSNHQCAGLPLIGVSAYCALIETAELAPGMKVLIHGGSGGVGSMAILLAKYIGADVYATCNSKNIDFVESLGATVIPYDKTDFTKVISGCDVVLDTIGGVVHEKSYDVLKKSGCLVYLNAKPFNDVSDSYDIETRQVNVMNKENSFPKMMALANLGILKPKISNVFSLLEFSQAFQVAESGKETGKVIITIGD